MGEITGKFLILSTALILTACGQESAIQKAVRGSLKDPESAKFGEHAVLDDKFACMTVNAKNSMGGYTGNQQALLAKKDGEWIVAEIDQMGFDECKRLMNLLNEELSKKEK